MLLAIGHFAVPFFFLMPRTIKRNRILLMVGALWMLFMHLWDLFWLVMPNLHREMTFSLLDATSVLGVGGVFLATAGWLLGRGSLVPARDPRLVEVPWPSRTSEALRDRLPVCRSSCSGPRSLLRCAPSRRTSATPPCQGATT